MFSRVFVIFLLCAFVICYCTPCEYDLLLESAFLKVGPVWNSFPTIYPRPFLEGGCHLQPCETCDY